MFVIEMYEAAKIVNVTELMSAQESAEATKKGIKRQTIYWEKVMQDQEKELQAKMTKFMPYLASMIENQAAEGHCCLELLWTKHNNSSRILHWKDWLKARDHFIPILEQAGYKVSWHDYSRSWQKQSGKFGYLHVSW